MSTTKQAKTIELNYKCIYIDDSLLPYGGLRSSLIEVAPPISSLFLYQIIASLGLLNAGSGRDALAGTTRAHVLIGARGASRI